jgi:hypothetical protein
MINKHTVRGNFGFFRRAASRTTALTISSLFAVGFTTHGSAELAAAGAVVKPPTKEALAGWWNGKKVT